MGIQSFTLVGSVDIDWKTISEKQNGPLFILGKGGGLTKGDCTLEEPEETRA